MRIALTKDLLGGLVFTGAGIVAVVTARNYTLGTVAHMGSGYFPTMVGGALILLGLVATVKAFLNPASSEPVARFSFRPFLFIAVALISFGFLLEDVGLIAALVALILISRLADTERRPFESIVMTIVLTAIAIGIFVFALHSRIPLGPS